MAKRQTTSDPAGESFAAHLAAAGPGVLASGGGAGHPDAPAPDANPELTASYAAAAAERVVPPTTAPARRNRTKADYTIQRWVEPPAVDPHGRQGVYGHWADVRNDAGEVLAFDDTAGAERHVRTERVLGTLQIVAVKRTLTVEEVQTTTLRVS